MTKSIVHTIKLVGFQKRWCDVFTNTKFLLLVNLLLVNHIPCLNKLCFMLLFHFYYPDKGRDQAMVQKS